MCICFLLFSYGLLIFNKQQIFLDDGREEEMNETVEEKKEKNFHSLNENRK